MVFQHINPETVGLKTQASQVHIKPNGLLVVGDRSTEGPGEYDIAGVGIHLSEATAVIFCEGIRVAVVWEPGQNGTLEDEAIDIFVLLVSDVKKATSIIKEYDPRVVLLHDAALAQALKTEDSLPVEQMASYKITQQTLPAGDRTVILLA